MKQIITVSSAENTEAKIEIRPDGTLLLEEIAISTEESSLSSSETKWFPVSSLPKLAYDHSEIIADYLHTLLLFVEKEQWLNKFYPADFTLPEIQHFLEMLFSCDIDRRNFRKHLLKEELIEETGYKEKGHVGRPAKLYRFKDKSEKLG